MNFNGNLVPNALSMVVPIAGTGSMCICSVILFINKVFVCLNLEPMVVKFIFAYYTARTSLR